MLDVRTLFLTALVLLSAVTADAQVPSPTLRVFLTDGATLTSFGEWARLGDRLVFSMPTSPDGSELQLVSIPAGRVDWARTERYAESVRATHYAATRAEADFAQMSAEVAQALNDVALISDPARRLERAERTRRDLADWPRTHYGYRASEVREIVGLLDEIISEMRAASGADSFEFTLVSDWTPPSEPLLPPPTQSEVVDQLMLAATLAETPAERVSLLERVLDVVDRAIDYLPASWAAGIRSAALAGVAEERALDQGYASLRASTLAEASRQSARADVRALERLAAAARARDAALGSRRPAEMAGIMGAINAHLETARQLRLAQDRWQLQSRSLRAYQRSVRSPVNTLVDATRGLEDIRALAGPSPNTLQSLAARLKREGPRLATVIPPEGLTPVHAVFRSAWELAENAVRLRLDAISTASIDRAREASAAAAGALLLLARARADLEAALLPPVRP